MTKTMQPQEQPSAPVGEGIQEIDVIAWCNYIWKKRRFVLKTVGAAIVAGLVIAFSMPREYTTTVRMAPETEEVNKRMNSLGGLAAMAGINLNNSAGSDAISPDLYPDVVRSTPFLLELYPVTVIPGGSGDTLSLYDYMHDHQRRAWWSHLLKLPFTVVAGLSGLLATPQPDRGKEIDPFHLTGGQQGVLEALQKQITVAVDPKTFVITLSVRMQDAFVSARLTEVVVAKLQDYISAYRTCKAKNDLEFTTKVFAEAREAYYKAQRAYAAFEDANRNLVSASYRTEQERLKNEMTLTFNVYNTLAQKLEQDKLRVQEQTPVYTVIEPATVPLKASSPKKPLMLVSFAFLGLAGAIGYLFVRSLFQVRAALPEEAEGYEEAEGKENTPVRQPDSRMPAGHPTGLP